MTNSDSQISAAAQNADDLASETLKNLQTRHWHLASVGLGNCRAAQALQWEIEWRQNRSGTGVSPVSSLNRTGADARATIEQLTAGLAHLESVGLANNRSAQLVRGELSRQLLIQSASLLANAGFKPTEPRDWLGRWTTGGNAGGAGTNSPNATKTAAPAGPSAEYKPTPYEQAVVRTGITDPEHESFEQWLTPEKQAYYEQLMRPTLRPMTWSEKLGFDLRQLMFKWLPGTRPSGQPSPGQVFGAASMLLPFGIGPETRLGKLLLGYFMAKTASEQPAYIRAIQQELQTGNYSDASRHAVEDALKIALIGAGLHGAVGGEGPKGPDGGSVQPPESRAGTPATVTPTSGPYSHFLDHPSVGPGKDFTKSQKARILSANEGSNSGVLKDDRTGEVLVRPQKSEKGVTPPRNEAHIDHVDPKSKGGANSFENAEVRSRANNLKKSNKVENDL